MRSWARRQRARRAMGPIGELVAKKLTELAERDELGEALETCALPTGALLIPHELMQRLRSYAQRTKDHEMLAILARATEWGGQV